MNISKYLVQKALYWGNPSNDAYGNITFDTPVEINCRWHDANEEIINEDGTKDISHSKVLVGQDLDIGGFLMLGVLEDIAESASMSDSESESVVNYSYPSPVDLQGAFRIKVVQKIPDKRARNYVRWAFL